ncbi:hypothetical protein ACFC4C_05165 [Streptomyces sp. NPDC056039]|uniref:hypothetical protein n=1 Tax=Streptomyces sp. NPDC056039 TaxID=3345687 RepID=UPI0035D9C836
MTTPGFRPTHVVPQHGMPAWEAPDPARPTVDLDPLLPVQLVERQGDWGHVMCFNGWSAWVDGRRLVAVPQDPPAADGPLTRTADSRPLLTRAQEALARYRSAVEDLAGGLDRESFHARTHGLRIGVVVDGESVWLYDAAHGHWVYAEGTRATPYATDETPSSRPEPRPSEPPTPAPTPTRVVPADAAEEPPRADEPSRVEEPFRAEEPPTPVVPPEPTRVVSPEGPEPARAWPPEAPEPTRVVSPEASEPARAAQPEAPEPTRVVASEVPEPARATPVVPPDPTRVVSPEGPESARAGPPSAPEPTRVVSPEGPEPERAAQPEAPEPTHVVSADVPEATRLVAPEEAEGGARPAAAPPTRVVAPDEAEEEQEGPDSPAEAPPTRVVGSEPTRVVSPEGDTR